MVGRYSRVVILCQEMNSLTADREELSRERAAVHDSRRLYEDLYYQLEAGGSDVRHMLGSHHPGQAPEPLQLHNTRGMNMHVQCCTPTPPPPLSCVFFDC